MKAYIFNTFVVCTFLLAACNNSIGIEVSKPTIDSRGENNTDILIGAIEEGTITETDENSRLIFVIIPEHIPVGDIKVENTISLSELKGLNHVLLVTEETSPGNPYDGPIDIFLVGNNTNTMKEARNYYLSLDKIFYQKSSIPQKLIDPYMNDYYGDNLLWYSERHLRNISIDGMHYLCMSYDLETPECLENENLSAAETKIEIFEGKTFMASFQNEYLDFLLSRDFLYYIYGEKIDNNYTYTLYKTMGKEKIISSPILCSSGIISEDSHFLIDMNYYIDEFVKLYSLNENKLVEKIYFSGKGHVRQMSSDGELLCTSGYNTYLTTKNRTEAQVIGQYMFDPLLSPDGQYLAYTIYPPMFFSSYVKYQEDGKTPLDKENEEIESRLKQMAKGIYILELSSGKTAFLPLTLKEGSEGFNIIGWAAKEPVDQFIKENQ